MTEFEELLRMRRLDSRNCDEEAKELLMLQAADRIAALEQALGWHVAGGHDELCGADPCNCGHALLKPSL